ncbi:MAG: ParA family protein [Spirochaetes bacterium]|jgi:hypothetical protein|nr:ParA family protein [Spirochaetota bacterium]
MDFTGFSDNHIFSFLLKREVPDFLSRFEPILFKKGAKLSINEKNIFYYYIESGSVAVSFDGVHKSLVLRAGDGFGRLPFAVSNERYDILISEDSLIYRIIDEKMLMYFLSDIKKIRGYLQTISYNGIEVAPDNYSTRLTDLAVIGVTGSIKSGKTLFSAVLAAFLSQQHRVLLIDASRSHKSIASFFSCEEGIPIVMKELRENFDINKYLVSVNEGLSIINFSNGEKEKSSRDLLAALVVHSSFDFDYIIIDGPSASLSEDVIANSDYLFNVCKNINEKRSASLWFDRFIEEGQKVIHVCNHLFSDSITGCSVDFPVIEKTDSVLADDNLNLEELKEISEIFNKKQTFFLGSSFYRSLPYVTLFENNPKAHFICTGFSIFFMSLYSFLNDRSAFSDQMNDFFNISRHKLFYKLVFPDERLYNVAYFQSYVKKLFGKARLEDLPVSMSAILSGEAGRLFQITTGSIADIVTAAFSRKPYFHKHYIAGRPFSASYTGQKNIMYRRHASDFKHVTVETEIIAYPFKEGSFLDSLARQRDVNRAKGDFIIDLPLLDLYNTQTIFK